LAQAILREARLRRPTCPTPWRALAMPARGRWPVFTTLLVVAVRIGHVDAEQSCVALSETLGRLNPGFWAPAFVFRSLQVRPGAIHPPNLTRSAQRVQLTGVCQSALLRADSFVWQRPTSDGGDWIASTASRSVSIDVDGVACPLTGIAVTMTGWPLLRLQFEECRRKTALEIPLINVTSGGLGLVSWMCKVTADSELCKRAAAQPLQEPAQAWNTQNYLDLSKVAEAASRGATRMQVYNDCYALDWYVVETPIGINREDFLMLLSIKSMIAPSFKSDVQIESSIVVETVCVPDCHGNMAPACYKRDYTVQASEEKGSDGSEPVTFDEFLAAIQEPEVKPVALALFGGLFLIGSLLTCCLLMACVPPPKKPERRIKSVAVAYRDTPNVSHAIFNLG